MSKTRKDPVKVYSKKEKTDPTKLLLKMLDQINDKARDLTCLFKEQGILPNDSTDNFRIISHKTMKKRIKLIYAKDSTDNFTIVPHKTMKKKIKLIYANDGTEA